MLSTRVSGVDGGGGGLEVKVGGGGVSEEGVSVDDAATGGGVRGLAGGTGMEDGVLGAEAGRQSVVRKPARVLPSRVGGGR